MLRFRKLIERIVLLITCVVVMCADAAEEGAYFQNTVMPVLERYCLDCHDPADSEGGVGFLEATMPIDLENHRSTWHSVAAQLRNRTMPPAKQKLQPSERERLEVANWIRTYLRRTAAASGPFVGAVAARRLNRLEYENTIRDLVGVILNFSETLPVEGGGGEGFENNGETLFMPPMLMERFLDAAQEVVDAAIVTPPLKREFGADDLLPRIIETELVKDSKYRKYPVRPGDEISILLPIYVTGMYEIALAVEPRKNTNLLVTALVDGFRVDELEFQFDRHRADCPRTKDFDIQLERGVHVVSFKIANGGAAGNLYGVEVEEAKRGEDAGRDAVHFRLLGLAPGQLPLAPRAKARAVLQRFVGRAFRRAVLPGEVEKFMRLFDRAAGRGDPFEECVKLAIKAVLVAPDFLFRLEKPASGTGVEQLLDHELASRLSYFLWATMPDDELIRHADAGRLNDLDVLHGQVERMLDDPRARVFSREFIGQWLGTRDVGGRVARMDHSIRHYYTPEVARSLRDECVIFFHQLIDRNRSVLDMIDSDYTYLNGRLAKFYQRKDWQEFGQDSFRKVAFSGTRRGGLLGMGAVLAKTSHFKLTSPVLRGAWVFDTMLGTPVPPPPPEVPELQQKNEQGKRLSVREMLEKHRSQSSCSACHNLIDPIGFALENFDFLGRWRADDNGRPLHTKGKLPSGEAFDGPEELRQVLMGRSDVFVRHLIRKVLGYALGRALVDLDEGTIERIARKLEASGFGARDLVREIIFSTPFRNKQSESIPGQN